MITPVVEFVKLHPKAICPVRKTDGAAGFDLFALHDVLFEPGAIFDIPIGIGCVIPHGYVGIIRSRSGLYFKHRVQAFHGTIDADFRGEIVVSMSQAWSRDPQVVKYRWAFAQLVVVPCVLAGVEITPEEFASRTTERGTGGLGSTDKVEFKP